MQDKNSNSRFGVDLNEFSQNVDFKVLTTQSDFLYLRSSGSGTGRFRVDKKFVEFAKEARNYGIPVGAYHYGIPSADLTTADAQANDFADILEEGFGEGDYGDLFPVIDVEEPSTKTLSVTKIVEWTDRFRRTFEKRTKRRLMLYTGLWYIQLHDNFLVPGKGYPLSNMPLWVAMYTIIPSNPPYPTDAGGWTRWRIWQFTETAIVKGVGNPCDGNWGPNSVDLLRQPRDVKGVCAIRSGGLISVKWEKNTDTDLSGYNLFANNYWIGTVDANETTFSIPTSNLPFSSTNPISITIEAFDLDGETSKKRTLVNV